MDRWVEAKTGLRDFSARSKKVFFYVATPGRPPLDHATPPSVQKSLPFDKLNTFELEVIQAVELCKVEEVDHVGDGDKTLKSFSTDGTETLIGKISKWRQFCIFTACKN